MALTIKEKEHWKERISRRIDHAIEQLLTNEDSEFRRRVEAQATERAWESLGIKSLRDEVLQIEQETARLAARREEVYAAMAAELPNGPVVPNGRTVLCDTGRSSTSRPSPTHKTHSGVDGRGTTWPEDPPARTGKRRAA